MNQLELRITTRDGRTMDLRYQGPASWDEVTPAQAVGLFRFRQRISQEPASLFPVLKLLYGMLPKHQRWLFDGELLRKQGMVEAEPMPQLDQVGEYELPDRLLTLQLGQRLIDTVRWVGLTEPGPHFIVQEFGLFDFRFGTVPVLLKKTLGQLRFLAPSEALGDSTFKEFMLADKAFLAGNLIKLAAILYRPGAPAQPGSRQALDGETIQERTALFAHLEPALLALIASQFQASKEYLARCFPHVFPKAESTGSGNAKTGNWLEVAIHMAKLDATKVPQIEALNLYLALKVLDEQVRQAQELEAELAKQRRSP